MISTAVLATRPTRPPPWKLSPYMLAVGPPAGPVLITLHQAPEASAAIPAGTVRPGYRAVAGRHVLVPAAALVGRGRWRGLHIQSPLLTVGTSPCSVASAFLRPLPCTGQSSCSAAITAQEELPASLRQQAACAFSLLDLVGLNGRPLNQLLPRASRTAAGMIAIPILHVTPVLEAHRCCLRSSFSLANA